MHDGVCLVELTKVVTRCMMGYAWLRCSKNMDLHTFAMIGRVLLKSIVDRRPVPARFAPSLFKFLLVSHPSRPTTSTNAATAYYHLILLILPTQQLLLVLLIKLFNTTHSTNAAI
jgi:hypothetical protein